MSYKDSIRNRYPNTANDNMRKIIIDTDPSPDDSLAVLVALSHPKEVELLAITTVGGNVPLEYTSRNALMTLELIDRRDIPVYAGAPGPIAASLQTATHVHGATGFDGYELPPPSLRLSEGYAPDKIVDILMSEKNHSVTLCCLAPLTNIALALIKEPRIVEKIEQIILMGGARSEAGNISPAAEYNFYVDPEAAAKVMSLPVSIVLLPLDCTHKALTTKERMQAIKAINSPVSEAFYHLITTIKRFDIALKGTDGGPLHDPTVTVFLLYPEIFSGRHVNVEVETRGTYTRGTSIVDWWGISGRKANAYYVDDLDSDKYFEVLNQAIKYF